MGERRTRGTTVDSRSLAALAARVASSKQAEAVLVLDVRELITITDYFVICSGTSERQVKTIADEVMKALREDAGVKPVRREGEVGARWLLLDFVDFVVHVFARQEREYYRLENLWRDAPLVEWMREETPSPAPADGEEASG